MRVLFIGGTGNISSACVALALRKGHEVTVFNRGTHAVPCDPRLRAIHGDRNDMARLEEIASETHYDVVANFLGYTDTQIQGDIRAFSGKVGQYVFISSASAYQKPLQHYVITESTPLENPFWQYARDKIACESTLMQAHRDGVLGVTIVRPTYTYGPTWIPCGVGGHGYTIVDRMRKGLPVISHGDGQSLWVMTHNSDFAVGFVGLLGNARALGEAFHITSDQVLTWDQIYRTIGDAAGCEPHLVHIPSDVIAWVYPEWGPGLLGDKACSVVFDNSKIKRVVPEYSPSVTFAEGIARSVAWHDEDPENRHIVDTDTSERVDRLVAAYQELLSNI